MKKRIIGFLVLGNFPPTLAHADDGSSIRPVLEPLLGIFKYDETAIVLSVVILLGARAVLSFYNRTSFNPMLREIKVASKAFASASSSSDFPNKFDEVDDQVRGLKSFNLPWQEFKETLLQIDSIPDEKPDTWHNTRRPKEYFNIETLDRGSSRFLNLEAYPNIFVGLGLLFTFLGLIAAIDEAGQLIGNGSQNSENAIDALQGMLTIASVKFLTSIAGILSSILLTVSFRRRKTTLDIEIGKLNERIENCMEFLPNEKLQIKTVEAISGLSSSIAKGVSDGVTKTVGNELKSFAEAIGGFTKTFNAPTKGVDQFKDSYQLALKELKTSIKENLGQISTSFDGFRESAETSLNEASNELMDANFRIASKMKNDLLDLSEDLGSKIENAAETAADISDSNISVVESLDELINHLGEQADLVKVAQDDAANSFQEKVSSLEAVASELSGAAASAIASLSDSGASFETVINKIRSENQDFNQGVASEIGHSIEEALAPTESLLEKFAELIEQNRETVGDFSEMLSGYDEASALLQSSLPDLMKEIAEERDRTVRLFGEALEAVNEKHTAAISNLQEAQKIANERHLTLLQDAIKKIENGSGVRSFSIFGKS